MCSLLFAIFLSISGLAQKYPVIEEINYDNYASGSANYVWLKLTEDVFGNPVSVPLIIIKGREEGPILGLTAAIHGNELNGIGVIHRVMESVDPSALKGIILAVPGLNAISLGFDERRFLDQEDLNRNFPGKENGNRSQQYVAAINKKILPKMDFLIDMHTASFGRENALYVRADMEDERIAMMALAQDADIILNNKGVPSTADRIAATRTMRAEAILKGVPTITVEYGNPQVFQESMISRGHTGIMNMLKILEMVDGTPVEVSPAFRCKKSYWIYVEEGGFLDVHVDNAEKVQRGQIIATLRNPFGEIIKEYECPEDGIIIGKSSNPVNMSGGRIIHLGIPE